MNYDDWKTTEASDHGRLQPYRPAPFDPFASTLCETHRSYHPVATPCPQCIADTAAYRAAHPSCPACGAVLDGRDQLCTLCERAEIAAEEEAGMQRAEAAFGAVPDDEDVDAYFDRFGV